MTDGRLGYHEKLKLTGWILAIYIPVIFIVVFPVYSVDLTYTFPIFRYQLTSLLIIAVVLYAWIDISERTIHRLARELGEEFLFEFKLTALALLALLAVTLSLTFVLVCSALMGLANDVYMFIAGKPLTLAYPEDHSEAFMQLYRRSNMAFFLLMMLGSFYLIAHRRINSRMKDLQLQSVRLQNEYQLAQISSLQDQLSPHFFFNSLSILSSLVDTKPVLSQQFIQELSRVYRYLLEQKGDVLVPLKRELAFIESYIFLLKIRFGERLMVTLPESVDDAWAIPPMCLQLLIENAVRHNQMSEEHPLHIRVVCDQQHIVVINNIQRRDDVAASTRKGLENIATRYRLIAGTDIVVQDNAGHFAVTLPLLTSSIYPSSTVS